MRVLVCGYLSAHRVRGRLATACARVRPFGPRCDRRPPASRRRGSPTAWAAPTAMAFAPDGRLFVAEQGGTLRVIKNGALLATPFVTVTVDSNGERGLLGVAFDPDFATNQFVYVYYTATTPNDPQPLSRFTAERATSPSPAASSIILDLDPLSSAHEPQRRRDPLRPDGKLYVAVGDNANGANAQTLRRTCSARCSGSTPTARSRPTTRSSARRPGRTARSGRSGLRNPFTFAFQPGHRPDVHQRRRPERPGRRSTTAIAGANYGWPDTEGPTDATRASAARSSPTRTARRRRPAARSPAARSTTRRPRSSRPPTSATTSSPTSAAAGSASSTDGRQRASPASPPASRRRSTSTVARRRRALLPRALARAAASTAVAYTGEPRADDHDAAGEPDGQRRPVGDLHRLGEREPRRSRTSGSATASNIAGATSSSYTLAVRAARRTTARASAPVTNSVGQRRRATRPTLTVTTNQAPTATITAPAAGTLYSGGADDHLRRHRHRPGGRDAAGARFTWRSTSTTPTTSIRSCQHDERRDERLVRDPDDGPHGVERLVPDPPDGDATRAASRRPTLPRRQPAPRPGPRSRRARRAPAPARRPAGHRADSFTGVVGIERMLEAVVAADRRAARRGSSSRGRTAARSTQTISTPATTRRTRRRTAARRRRSPRRSTSSPPPRRPWPATSSTPAPSSAARQRPELRLERGRPRHRVGPQLEALTRPALRHADPDAALHEPERAWELAVPNGSYTRARRRGRPDVAQQRLPASPSRACSRSTGRRRRRTAGSRGRGR